MKPALLMLLFVAAASPALADPNRVDQHSGLAAWGQPWTISCEAVRAYVSQVGLAQAKATARANGMTAAQEWLASRCLAKKA
jgi:hypothetical protein